MDSDDVELVFPDVPRSRLDLAIRDLLGSAQEVLATEGRLRSLLKASRVVADELELPVVLRTIVEAAVELVGARYGAIGVVNQEGMLEQFIHVGMPDELIAHIGHLPEGHGVLGALIADPRPIRLAHLSDDPRSVGFPDGHPAMDSFVGVPVRVRGEVYGNLYLTEQLSGQFSAEDEQLLSALAATAGAAIDHARLYDESERRRKWSAASAEITATLLSDDSEQSLSILAERVAVLADADVVCVVVPLGAENMSVEMAGGALGERFVGSTFPEQGTLAAQALASRQPILADRGDDSAAAPELSIGPTMAVPLTSADNPMGVLTVSRRAGSTRFTVTDLDMAAEFATQAGLALRLAAGRRDAQTLALLEDRGRIARDLHDHVIQRLFGAGLSLQAVAGSISNPTVRAKLDEQIESLDDAIAEIRTAIFTMTAQASARPLSLRHRVIDTVGEMAALFSDSPQLSFGGAIDLLVPTALSDDIIAVVREGLTNVARHANCTQASVAIVATTTSVTVVVEDDGVGLDPQEQRRSGLSNLDTRAANHGGGCLLTARVPSGTTLSWSVPLSQGSEA
ncbi:MAG: GAF domain-containing protein [Salinibacterium sp.]|nr:GAF domain-containing protein [Salinibacterium sp.]